MLSRILLPLVAAASALAAPSLLARRAAAPWEELPPTPNLPGSPIRAKASVNGIEIWHAEFGSPSSAPLLFLHGGFGNSDYWGDVISELMADYYIVAVDNRGQGRSTMDDTAFTFNLYASDAAAVLKSLGIQKASWIGWSEGADAALAALLDPKLAPYVQSAYVYGAWHDVAANNETYTSTAIYNDFITRARQEYRNYQPNGNLTKLADQLTTLESTQPTWTATDLAKISLGNKLTLGFGQYEEAIKLSEPAFLQGAIKGSRLDIIPNVSHFGPLQDPKAVANSIRIHLKV